MPPAHPQWETEAVRGTEEMDVITAQLSPPLSHTEQSSGDEFGLPLGLKSAGIQLNASAAHNPPFREGSCGASPQRRRSHSSQTRCASGQPSPLCPQREIFLSIAALLPSAAPSLHTEGSGGPTQQQSVISLPDSAHWIHHKCSGIKTWSKVAQSPTS